MKTIITVLFAVLSIGCAQSSSSGDGNNSALSSFKAKYYYSIDNATEFKFYKIYFYNSGKYQTIFATLTKSTGNIVIDSQNCNTYATSTSGASSGKAELDGVPVYADGSKPYQDLDNNTFSPPTYSDGSHPVIDYSATKDFHSSAYIETLTISGVNSCQ